jgi:hypothetical protein
VGDTVVVDDALVDFLGGIDGKVALVTDAADGLDVVGMVVGNQHMVNRTKAKAIVAKLLLERPDSNSYIYYQTIRFGV